jgi:hypothetical protein
MREETPAERAASHGLACSSQPERRRLPLLRPPYLSRFSCRGGGPAPAAAVDRCENTAPSQAPSQQRARAATAAPGSSPALSDRTLDFTTPGTCSAQASAQRQQALFLEQRLVCSELLPQAAAQALSMERVSPSISEPGVFAGRARSACFGVAPDADSQQELEAALRHAASPACTAQPDAEPDDIISSSLEAEPAHAGDADEDCVPETVSPRLRGGRQAAAFLRSLPAYPMLEQCAEHAAGGAAAGQDRTCSGSLGMDLQCAEALPACRRRQAFSEDLAQSVDGDSADQVLPGTLHEDGDSGDGATRAAVLGLLASPEAPFWGSVQKQPQSAGWGGFYEGPDIIAESDAEEELLTASPQHDAAPGLVRTHPLALAGEGAAAAAARKRLGSAGLQRPPAKRMRAGVGTAAAAMQLPGSPTLDNALQSHNAAASSLANAQSEAEQGSGRAAGSFLESAQQQERGSVLQELSAEADQEAAALLRLLTPQRARMRQHESSVLQQLSAEKADQEAALERLLTPQRSGRAALQALPPQEQSPRAGRPPSGATPQPPAPLRSCAVEGVRVASAAAPGSAEPAIPSPRSVLAPLPSLLHPPASSAGSGREFLRTMLSEQLPMRNLAATPAGMRARQKRRRMEAAACRRHVNWRVMGRARKESRRTGSTACGTSCPTRGRQRARWTAFRQRPSAAPSGAGGWAAAAPSCTGVLCLYASLSMPAHGVACSLRPGVWGAVQAQLIFVELRSPGSAI